MFPPRITGSAAGPFIQPDALRRLGSIALFYLTLGVCGVVLVLISYAGAAAINRTRPIAEEPLQGPILYLVIIWGIITAIFVALLIWRSLLTSHEDDQIFLDAAEEHMAREQRELVAKITSLSRPIATSGIAAGALLLLIVGLWLFQGLKSF